MTQVIISINLNRNTLHWPLLLRLFGIVAGRREGLETVLVVQVAEHMRVSVQQREEVDVLEAEQAVAPAQAIKACVVHVLPCLLHPRPCNQASAPNSFAAEARQVQELEATRVRLRLASDRVVRVHVGAHAGLRLVYEEGELIGEVLVGFELVVEHEVSHETVQVACAACVFLMALSICVLHAISYIHVQVSLQVRNGHYSYSYNVHVCTVYVCTRMMHYKKSLNEYCSIKTRPDIYNHRTPSLSL